MEEALSCLASQPSQLYIGNDCLFSQRTGTCSKKKEGTLDSDYNLDLEKVEQKPHFVPDQPEVGEKRLHLKLEADSHFCSKFH